MEWVWKQELALEHVSVQGGFGSCGSGEWRNLIADSEWSSEWFPHMPARGSNSERDQKRHPMCDEAVGGLCNDMGLGWVG